MRESIYRTRGSDLLTTVHLFVLGDEFLVEGFESREHITHQFGLRKNRRSEVISAWFLAESTSRDDAHSR